MKKNRVRWVHFVILSLVAMLIVAGGIVSVGADGSSPAAIVQRAWRNARDSGVYDFQTEITQVTHPGPALANVGRSSVKETLSLSGHTDLPAGSVQISLWDESSGQGPQDALHMRMEGERAYGRCPTCDAWEEIDDFRGALFPGSDMMVYLTGAKQVTAQGNESRLGIRFTRYSFEVDGPAFGDHMRQQMEDYLRANGELPGNITLDVARQYTDMVGQGEIWITEDGLPLRLAVHLEFPTGANGDWIEAEIRHDFSHFDLQWARAPRLLDDPGGWVTARLARAARRAGNLWPQAGGQALAAMIVVAMVALLVSHGRRRRVYATVVVALILSMVVTPLLQTHQVAAFYDRQAAQAAEQDERQRKEEAAQDYQDLLSNADWDPHEDPWTQATPETGEGSLERTRGEAPLDEVPLPSLYRLLQDAGNGDPNAEDDEDGDTLTWATEQFLGTNPTSDDTDGDGITDNVEVEGFEYNGKHWYLNPRTPDSNNDGLIDSLECPECWRLDPTTGLSPQGVCQDSDSDGTPDVFDRDNDGDGVSDRVDMAPGDAMGMDSPFSSANPFFLTVDNLETDITTFVNIQLRPTEAEHLSYMYNVLDWPTGDTEGQIQRVLETTWRDQFAGGSESDTYGDMRLIPLLEITIPHLDGHYGNLPVLPGAPEITGTVPITTWLDTSQLEPYGIQVNYKDETGDLLTYVPLKLVYDETGGGKAAFAARMVYQPSVANWGPAQEVRVVWLVQAVVDQCNLETFAPSAEAEEDAELYAVEQAAHCADPDNRIESVQVVHSYGEEWTLTGLAVREDHGMDLAVVLEDPVGDDDVNEDHNLWALANSLGKSFMAGRDEDDDGERDIDIAEIENRFDNQTNTSIPAGDERLWGLDQDAFRVETYTYPTQDYIAHIPMTVTLEVLDTYFMSGSSCLSETPLLLFAREEHYRSVALGGGADVVEKIDDGRGLRVTMGAETVPNYTTAYMQWQTYRRVDEAWEPYALEDYYDPLYVELKDLLQDQEFGPEDLSLEDTVALAVYYYISLQQGASGLVQGGSIPVDNPFAEPDSSLTLWYTWISYYKDLYTMIAGEVAGPILEIMQYHWGKISPDKLGFYGLLYQVEPGNVGRMKYTAAETWRDLTVSQIAFAAGVVIGGAVICMGLAVLANFFEIMPIVHIQNLMGVLFATMNMVEMITSFVKTVGVAMLKSTYTTLSTAEWMAIKFQSAVKGAEGVTKAAVVGLILEVAMQWGGFILNWALSGVAAATLAFTQMLAEVIAQTVASIILFAIACIPVVGQIIMTIMGLIDAVIWAICGFLPEDVAEGEAASYICRGISGLVATFVGWLIYSQTILVDFNDTGRLAIHDLDQRFVDPLKGMASDNTLAYSAAMTNTITMVDPPVDWKAQVYSYQYNLDEFRSSTFDYAFELEEPEDDAGKLHNTAGLGRNQMNETWAQVADRSLQSTDTVYITGVPLPSPGLDQPISLYLAEGFAVPAQECWALPVVTPFGPILVPVCYIRTFEDTSYMDVGQSFVFDVFPATLSEFYDLARVDTEAGIDGGFRLAWDERFPRLMDADGDGLLNKADGGADPNDSLWDADLDGLGDLYEYQKGSDPVMADTDGDELSDWDEILRGTDPRRADTDGDGLLDGQEMFHQLETGVWAGGWEIVYGYDDAGNPLRTWVSSDPLSIDGDQDGWTDYQEKTYGYHPAAPNASTQLTFESELSELGAGGDYVPSDGFVAPGDTLYFDAQVSNELMGRQARGLLSAEASTGLDPEIMPVTFSLQPLETQVIAGEIAVRSDAATAHSNVSQVAGALITDPGEEAGHAVASLHLDEATGATTFADSSGAPLHDGTCSGDVCPQAEVEGAYGYAARFDGADDYLSLGSFQVEGHVTLSAWCKPEALNGQRNIIVHEDGGSPGSGVVLRMNNGNYEVGSYDSVGDHLVAFPIPGADVNAWVHLVGVYDGGAWRLYRNGDQVAMSYDVTGAVYADAPWIIGANGDGSDRFFQGDIDEVLIYDISFSSLQVQELYRRPVLHFALDEETGAIMFSDSSGSDNRAWAPGGNLLPDAGREGISQRAVYFNGNARLVVEPNPSLVLHGSVFTLAAWVKPTNSGDSAKDNYAQGVIGLNSGEAEAYPTLQIVGRKLRTGFSAEVDGSYRWYEYTTVNDLVIRESWNHVAVTFDGERLRFYVNGQHREDGIPQDLDSGDLYPATATLYPADRLTIGRSNVASVYLDSLYVASDESEYDLLDTTVDLEWDSSVLARQNGLQDGDTWTIDRTMVFAFGVNLDVYTDNWWENVGRRTYVGGYTYLEDTPPPADNNVNITLRKRRTSDGMLGISGTLYTKYYNHAIPFRGYLDDVRIYKRPLVVTDLENEVEELYHAGTVAMRLRLDEPPGATAFADWTGQHPGSAPAGGATQPTSGLGGRVNQAVRFDGVDDRIGVDLPLAPEYTLGAWVRFLGTGWSGGPYTILEFGDDAPWLGVNAAGELALNGSSGGVSGGNVPVGEWVHVAYTWDGAQGQLYLNGQPVGSALTAPPVLSNTLGIGHGAGQAAWFGDIDEVIAYRQALGTGEIQSLCGSAPQLALHLDEDLLDSSGNDYHATCVEGKCPAQDIQGRIGRAVSFDGVDDYLQLPTADTLGLPGEDWTISAWLKADALAASGTHALLAQGSPTGSNLFLGIKDGQPYLYAYGLVLTGETPLEPNAWYHLAWNVDVPEGGSGEATGTILLNGAVVAQTQFSYVSGGGLLPVYVGGTPGGYPFHGVIDELTMYHRLLSTRDLREIYTYQMSWVEERVRTPIVIDADEPESMLLSDGSIYGLRDTVMAIAASDPTSRIGIVEWRINGGAWSDCPICLDSDSSWCPTFDPPAEGRYIIETRATDIVGHVQSTPSSHTIHVDDQAPQAVQTMSSDQVLPAPRHESLRFVRYVELAGQAADPLISGQYAGSGVAIVVVELLDAGGASAGRGQQAAALQASGTPGTVNWSLRYLFDEADPTGAYTLRVTVEDRMGNSATTDLMTIHVDARPPLMTQTYPDVQVEEQSSLTDTATLITGSIVDDTSAAAVEIAFSPAENGSVFSEAAPELVLPFDRDWLADGSTLRDATGQAAVAAVTHDALNHATTGQVGSYGLYLDGVDDVVSVDRDIPLADSSFTIEFWARTHADGVLFRHGGDESGKALLIGFAENDQFIFSFDDSCTSPLGLAQAMALASDGSEVGELAFAKGELAGQPSPQVQLMQVPDSEWAHYAFVYDAEAGQRYIYWRRADSSVWNGMQISQGSGTAYEGTGSITLGAGALPSGCSTFHGDVDNLLVSGRALSLDEIKATDSGWRAVSDVTLAADGKSATWQYPVPEGMEGLYEIRLRGRDNAGNISSSDAGSPVWRGAIDTLAPRFMAVREHLGEGSASKTRFSGYAEDFNLSESGFACPCPPELVAREYFAAPWYTEIVTNSVPHLYRLAYTCEVPGYDYSVTSFAAGDIYAHTVEDIEGGLQALGSLTLSGTPVALDMAGSTGYLAMGTDGLALVDASDPESPVLAVGPSTGGAQTAVDARDVAADGSYAYLADPGAGVRVFDVDAMVEVVVVPTGEPTLPATADAVSLCGDNLCVGTANNLDLIDVTTPSDPSRVNMSNQPWWGQDMETDVFCDNTYGYAWVVAQSGSGYDGLRIWNLELAAGSIWDESAKDTGTGKLFSRVVVENGYAYVTGKDENTGATLYVYRAVHPSEGVEPLGSYTTTLNAGAIAVEGNYAFLAEGDTLHVLEVGPLSSDPLLIWHPVTIQEVASMQLGAAIKDLYVSDGYIYALTNQFEVLRMAGGTEYPTTVILSPAHGAVYDTASPIVPIHGWAYAENGSLAGLAVIINGTQHYTTSWSAGEESDTWTAPDWTPAADGAYLIEAVSTDTEGGTLTDAITVILDTAAPSISLPTTVFTTTHYDPGAGQIDLTGRTSDAAGAGWLTATVTYDGAALLALVEGDGGLSSVDGTWAGYLYVDADAPPDGSQGYKLLQATVTDLAGRTATVQQNVLIDVVRPAAVTLELKLDATQALETGAAIHQDSANLDLTWTQSSDAMGVVGYTVTWTDGDGHVLQQHDIDPTAERSDRLVASGPARVMARLTIRDIYGNEQVQSVGPIYVDGPATPDYVTLLGDEPPYHGWMDSGTTLIGTDRRINDNSPKGAALWEEQKLYATWDASGLRLAWTGADWSTDGDLLILLDTIPGQGTTHVPDLYGGAGSTIYLPGTTPEQAGMGSFDTLQSKLEAVGDVGATVSRVLPKSEVAMAADEAMAADYLVWVRDADLANLYHCNDTLGCTFVAALGAEHLRTFGGLNGGHTDLYLPFNQIGISNPALAVVEMVALASEEGALALWSAMPPQNPVSSGKVNEFGEYVSEGTAFGLLQRYRWEGLGDGVSPNGKATGALLGARAAQAGTSYLDVDLTLRVTTDPAGSVYGYLRDGLFWMWDALFASERPSELSQSFDFMDPDHPALGDGQRVSYTLRATNRGQDAAQSVYAQLAAHYALRLLDSGGNPVDNLLVTLGDVGPGQTVDTVVSGSVALAHARDTNYLSCLAVHADDPAYCDRYLRWAQLDIRFYDAAHGEAGRPLDWVWVDHAVDPQAPQFYGLQSPRCLISPTGATLSGYAYDNSAVDHVELNIGGATGESVPQNGQWSYPWSLSGAQDGDEYDVSLRAVDEFGQAGEWTDARTLVVDATPPTVILDPLVLQNVAGRTLRSDPATLSGALSDNRGAGGVEICIDGRCQQAQTSLVRGEARSYDNTSATSVGDSTGPVAVTFTVYDNFLLGDIGLGLTIDHPYRDDLVATLTSPAGTTVRVLSGRRTLLDTFAHYDRLLFDAAPGDLFSWQGDDDPLEPAFDRVSRPYAPLGAFVGEDAQGTWTLRIWDADTSQHAGTYQRARLILTPQDVEPRSGTWRYTIPLVLGAPEGERTIEIYAWDSVGNRTAAPLVLSYRLDRTAPELAVTEAVEAIVSMDPTPVLTGTVSDAGTITALYVVVEGPGGDKVQNPVTWWQAGAWGHSLQPKGEGTYKLWINAEDEAGNGSWLGPLEVSVTAPPPPPPQPQVQVRLMTDVETSCPASPVWYLFVLTNVGDQALTNLTVTDMVPEGACCPVDISEPGAVSEDGASIVWHVDELAVGETLMAMVTLTTPGNLLDGDEFVNVFTYSAAELSEGGEASLGIVVDLDLCVGVDAGQDQEANEGDTVSVAATFVDGRAVEHTATINWGDGTEIEGAVDEAAFTIAGSHVYADNDTYVVTVSLHDGLGSSASDTLQVIVNNVAPVAALDNDGPRDEGSPVTVWFKDIVEPGSADVLSYSFDWNNDGTYDIVDQGTSSALHTWLDNGTYTVTGRIRDDDGGLNEYTTSVIVHNVAPEVNAGDDATVDEGGTFTSSGSFTDPGADTWIATVDYADGSGVQPLTLKDDKTFDLSHLYADNGAYTVEVCVTDDELDSDCDAAGVTVNNVAPAVTADPESQTVQYSEAIAEITFTATDVAADTMTAVLSWSADGAAFTAGNPAGLELDGGTCDADESTNTCTWKMAGTAEMPAGTYTLRLTVTDKDNGVTTYDVALTVGPEEAVVEFNDDNPAAVQVATAGGNSGPFTLSVCVSEKDTPPAGDISLAQVSMSLVPVGPGGPYVGVADTPTVADEEQCVTFSFGDVAVNTYVVQVTVDGDYYTGSGEDVLVVYDPSLGFTTGGGWFYWPGTANEETGYPGDKTNFGFTMKYNKKATNIKGSLLLIRHLADDTIYRVKSNALYGLALGEDSKVPMGWASFSGKSTYQEPGWIEPIGNYEFTVYVEDRNEPGSGVDRFWIEVVNGLSLPREAVNNAVELGGGNIVVPHQAARK